VGVTVWRRLKVNSQVPTHDQNGREADRPTTPDQPCHESRLARSSLGRRAMGGGLAGACSLFDQVAGDARYGLTFLRRKPGAGELGQVAAFQKSRQDLLLR